MGKKALSAFTFKNRLKAIKYSIGSKLINSVPKGIQKTYEFLNWLEAKSISFHKKGNFIQFEYPIEDRNYVFSLDESSSDSDVFKQIILEKEYELVLKLIAKNKINIKSIVDAGANVGYTSLYLAHFNPDAEILALEPNESTFQRLHHTLESNKLTNVKTLQKGLWNKDTFLKADHTFRDGQAWSFRLEETQNEKDKLFETTCISRIFLDEKWETIDLLKIDIEGGEDALFKIGEDLSWLKNVKVIAIEIHDEFECRERIEQMLRDYKFELSYSGELTLGINRLLSPLN